MAIQWEDGKMRAFLDRWQRRGELLVGIGLTAAFTWLAASLPTRSTTHVDVWPPLIVTFVVAGIGIYAIVVAETGKGWLPGKRRLGRSATDRGTGEIVGESLLSLEKGAPSRQLTDALNRLAGAIENSQRRD